MGLYSVYRNLYRIYVQAFYRRAVFCSARNAATISMFSLSLIAAQLGVTNAHASDIKSQSNNGLKSSTPNTPEFVTLEYDEIKIRIPCGYVVLPAKCIRRSNLRDKKTGYYNRINKTTLLVFQFPGAIVSKTELATPNKYTNVPREWVEYESSDDFKIAVGSIIPNRKTLQTTYHFNALHAENVLSDRLDKRLRSNHILERKEFNNYFRYFETRSRNGLITLLYNSSDNDVRFELTCEDYTGLQNLGVCIGIAMKNDIRIGISLPWKSVFEIEPILEGVFSKIDEWKY